MCTMFSQLQNLRKRTEEGDRLFEEKFRRAVTHIEFCVKIYKHQDDNRRYYLHEHPQTATSWQLKVMRSLAATPKAIEIVSHLCQFNLITTDEQGNAVWAKKPTRFITNSAMIAKELERRCSGEHTHGHLLSGRAGPAARYTPSMCRAIVRGIIAQKELDCKAMAQISCVESVKSVSKEQENEIHSQSRRSHEEQGESMSVTRCDNELMRWYDEHCGELYAEDDVSGSVLDPNMVIKARRMELDFFRTMRVYEKVPRWRTQKG